MGCTKEGERLHPNPVDTGAICLLAVTVNLALYRNGSTVVEPLKQQFR